jgi:hypothetical protein
VNSLRDLIQPALLLLRRNRLIWLFAGIAFAAQLLNLLIPKSSTLWEGLLILFAIWLAGLYALAGTIHAAANAASGRSDSFLAAQQVIWRRILSLGLLYFAPLIAYNLLTWVLDSRLSQTGADAALFPLISGVVTAYGLLAILLGWMLFPLLLFCLAGVLIEDLTLRECLHRGWRAYVENLPAVIKIALAFFAAWLILRAMATWLGLVFNGQLVLGPLRGDALHAIQYLFLSPYAAIISLLFFPLFLDPLQRIVLTRIYKNL